MGPTRPDGTHSPVWNGTPAIANGCGGGPEGAGRHPHPPGRTARLVGVGLRRGLPRLGQPRRGGAVRRALPRLGCAHSARRGEEHERPARADGAARAAGASIHRRGRGALWRAAGAGMAAGYSTTTVTTRPFAADRSKWRATAGRTGARVRPRHELPAARAADAARRSTGRQGAERTRVDHEAYGEASAGGHPYLSDSSRAGGATLRPETWARGLPRLGRGGRRRSRRVVTELVRRSCVARRNCVV